MMTPLRSNSTPHRSRFPSRATPADRHALVFGLSRALASDVRAVAQELEIGVAEPAHLHAACLALAQYPGSLLLLSPSLKPWDRDVVLDHAARSRADIVFVDRDLDARTEQAVSELERWARRRR
jgi:hypothetical protein